MNESQDTFELIFLAAVVILFIVGFVAIALKSRKGLGGLTHIMYGATDEFYTKDKKRAIEIMMEQKAGKKMEEQESGEDKKD
ncbi:hypothetical protein ACFLTH_11425 [Bacteroidota bacterium]